MLGTEYENYERTVLPSLLISLIFDKLSPTKHIFQNVLYCKSFFESIQVQKTFSEALKTWYFSYSGFWSAGQWGLQLLAPWLRYWSLTCNYKIEVNLHLSRVRVYISANIKIKLVHSTLKHNYTVLLRCLKH